MAGIHTRQVHDVVVITPHGYLVGGDETDELKVAVEAQLATGNRKLVVDLIETVHLNSSALGTLNLARTRYEEQGGRVKLCHVTHRIQNALVITRLALHFDVHETEAEAIRSFAVEVAG